MPRLKDRDHFIPEGFQFLVPEIGMNKPISGSFNAVVAEVIKIRRANPYLTEKFGWSTDVRAVENEVDAYNTARCQAHGWTQWIVEDNTWIEPPPYPPDDSKKNFLGAAGGSVRKVKAGVAVLLSWLGSSAKPVDVALAEKRAGICSTCPKNGKGDFTAIFTKPMAEMIRTQIEIKNELRLKTSYEDKLGVCEVCACPLKLKPWVGLEHILAHLSADVRKNLPAHCWIVTEEGVVKQ